MLISKDCLEFVKRFEGFYPYVYKDIVEVPTIGYGMTGKEIEGLTHITEPQASQMLEKLLNEKYATPIKNNLDFRRYKLNQNEFDALVSMAYNVGVNGVLGSTLYKNITQGIRDKKIITENFLAWNKAGGKEIPGLTRRRKEEAEMFFKPSNPSFKAPKVNYVLEYQKWYNRVTQTAKPIVEDGVYGPQTLQALNTMELLIKGGK